jgi:disulfide bond formation protein DsbB
LRTARRPGAAAYVAFAALASAAMLAAAHAFERLGGYQPCLLCLRQREVYWIALAVALLGIAALRARPHPSLTRALPLLLALVFFVGFGVAGYHAGVEWKWWAGPKACAVGTGVSLDALEALAGGAKVRVVSCEEAAWVMAGLSMAGWNALVSLGLAGLGVAAAVRERAR